MADSARHTTSPEKLVAALAALGRTSCLFDPGSSLILWWTWTRLKLLIKRYMLTESNKALLKKVFYTGIAGSGKEIKGRESSEPG